jgi:hypothetical protein
MSPNNISPLQAFTNKKLTNMTIRSKNLPFTASSLPVLSGNYTSSLNLKIFKNQEVDVIKISKNPEDWIKPVGYLSWEKNQEI